MAAAAATHDAATIDLCAWLCMWATGTSHAWMLYLWQSYHQLLRLHHCRQCHCQSNCHLHSPGLPLSAMHARCKPCKHAAIGTVPSNSQRCMAAAAACQLMSTPQCNRHSFLKHQCMLVQVDACNCCVSAEATGTAMQRQMLSSATQCGARLPANAMQCGAMLRGEGGT